MDRKTEGFFFSDNSSYFSYCDHMGNDEFRTNKKCQTWFFFFGHIGLPLLPPQLRAGPVRAPPLRPRPLPGHPEGRPQGGGAPAALRQGRGGRVRPRQGAQVVSGAKCHLVWFFGEPCFQGRPIRYFTNPYAVTLSHCSVMSQDPSSRSRYSP